MASSSNPKSLKSSSKSQKTPTPKPKVPKPSHFLSQNLYTPILDNNYQFDPLRFTTPYNVIINILLNHPIFYALSGYEEVPEVYVQQLWHTIKYNSGLQLFEATIGDTHVTMDYEFLRTQLKLPCDMERSFDILSSATELCADIQLLGYEDHLTRPFQFKRAKLSKMWCTLFSILNRSLTSKHTGMDTSNVSVLHMLQGIAFQKHYDYALLIWKELQTVVGSKMTRKESAKKKFLPFMRFFTVFVHAFLEQHPNLPRFIDAPIMPVFHIQYFKAINGSATAIPMVIPLDLLLAADLEASCVVEYISTHYPSTILPEPVGSTQEATQNIQGEGLGLVESRSDQSATESESSAHTQSDSEDDQNDDQNDDENDDEDDDDEDDDTLIRRESRTKKRHEKQIVTESSSSEDQSNMYDSAGFEFEQDVGLRAEDVVEQIEERMSVAEIGLKEIESPSQNESVNRVTTSATGLHSLMTGIEKDVMDPVTQCTTPPTHSVSSQQEIVSFVHGDFTHPLSTSHLENLDIEIRGHQLQSSPSLYAHCLGPYYNLSRTLVSYPSLRGFAHVGHAAGTSIVVPSIGISQGLEGNPTRANIMPTLNVGHSDLNFVSSAMQTGNLSDPGFVNVTPSFIADFSRFINDSIQTSIQDQFENLRKSSRATLTSKPAESIPSNSTPSSSTSSQTESELKELLLNKLQNRSSSLTIQEQTLVNLLKPDSTFLPASVNDIQLIRTDIQSIENQIWTSYQSVIQLIEKVDRRLTSIESTCRPQASGSKRKHDDPDSQDHHEGEKRHRVSNVLSGEGQLSEETEVIVEAGPSGSQAQQVDEIMCEASEPMTVEKPEVQIISEEQVERYLKQNVIEIISDDEDEVLNSRIKIELEDELGTENVDHDQILRNVSASIQFNQDEGTSGGEQSENFDQQESETGEINVEQRKEIRRQIKEVEYTKSLMRSPFLEEFAREMFVHKIRPLGLEIFYGLENMNQSLHREFFLMMKAKARPVRHVHSELLIMKINQIIIRPIVHLYYPEFYVTRQDMDEWIFSEADFPSLTSADIHYIFEHLRCLTVRRAPELLALEAVKRFMRAQARHASMHDFQLAFEARHFKVNLIKPNQKLEGIENIPLYTLMIEPEFGMIFKNRRATKTFLRFSELTKYSRGTLSLMRLHVDDKLKRHKSKQELLPFSERKLYDKAVLLHNDLNYYRNAMRSYEIAFGERPKKFFTLPSNS